MDLYRSVRAVTDASRGEGAVDWAAAAEAAKGATDPGDLALTAADRRGYAGDARTARDRLRSVAGVPFDLPSEIQVQNRHHWIDANVETFRRVMAPVESRVRAVFPGATRVANTAVMAATLGFLGRNVLGQYDPLLLADDPAEHGLYFVHPNIVSVSAELDVDYERFRRWIAFHEVAHAAEFGAAPWLPNYLESRLEEGVVAASQGALNREAFRELNAAMTVVEGYAELLMDRAFDDEYADLRRKVDERRGGNTPVGRLLRRLLGLGLKRRQYELGAEFFRHVADERGVAAAATVWEGPDRLPTPAELDDPALWVARVDP